MTDIYPKEYTYSRPYIRRLSFELCIAYTRDRPGIHAGKLDPVTEDAVNGVLTMEALQEIGGF